MTVRVKNWAKFQHFKDRRPPWIKLYRDILDDVNWHKLDPVAAKALMSLWLIASENDGFLPDVETLAFRLRKSDSEIEDIISKLSHWLEQTDIARDDTLISERYQDDAPERETERERETEKEGDSAAAASPPAPVRKKTMKTSMPVGFAVSDRVRAWATEKGYDHLPEHLDAFTRKASAKGYTYADWDSAFMEAIREDWAKLRGRAFNGAAPPPDIQGPRGPDPALEKIRQDSLKAAPIPPEIRAQLAGLRGNGVTV